MSEQYSHIRELTPQDVLALSDDLAVSGDLLPAYNLASWTYRQVRQDFQGTMEQTELLSGAVLRCISIGSQLRFSKQVGIAWALEGNGLLESRASEAHKERIAIMDAGLKVIAAGQTGTIKFEDMTEAQLYLTWLSTSKRLRNETSDELSEPKVSPRRRWGGLAIKARRWGSRRQS